MTAGATAVGHLEQTAAGAGFPLRVVAAAFAASLAAGATGVFIVLGSGLIELPGFVAAGLLYALLPGMLTLALVHRFAGSRRMPAWQSLAAYMLLAALGGAVWFLPFVGLYVPLDRADALSAASEMALYHAASGAVGGLAFWLLTRRRPKNLGFKNPVVLD